MELNQQQKAAAEFDDGHVLVLAGAGTGKTRTIIARAAHLISSGVAPYRILLLTFTRRAAAEMTMRLQQMIGDESNQILAGTFHYFCLYTMRRMPNAFNIANSTVIDRDDQLQLMSIIRGDYKKLGKDLPRAAELVNLCSYARNTNQSFRNYVERYTDYKEKIVDVLCEIADLFDARKKENGYLDYDDILHRFAETVQNDPEVCNRLRSFYDHILVDEMQDTNPLQWLILDSLRDPAKLFCVGDDAQSIYAFRGADFQNVHSFTLRVPDSKVLRLEENYRSTQGILDLSNWLLDVSPIDYNKYLSAHRKTRSTPTLRDFGSDMQEAGWVARDLIRRHHDLGRPWSEHMIITRTGYGARTLESYMVENNIPYRFIGGTSLLQLAHVKDLFGLVRSATNHLDALSWIRYLKLFPKIGDVTANRIATEIRQAGSMEQALDFLSKKFKKRPEILAGTQIVRENMDVPAHAIHKAAQILMPIMETRYENWEQRLREFDLLERLAERHRTINGFVETYILDPISATSAQQDGIDDVVTLTTVHSAKGTEAPVCYLIRVEPGMYPHVRSLGSEEEMEEERRILYVAMTRAQDELIITRTYNGFGMMRSPQGYTYRQSSDYFLDELDDSLVKMKRGRVF